VRAVPGRFKHVSLVGLCPFSRVWVGLDTAIDQTRVWVWKDSDAAVGPLGAWMADALVVTMPAPELLPQRARVRGLFSCVSAAAHVLGIAGAVRPDGLLRECLRNGGQIIAEPLSHADAETTAGR